MKKEDPPFEFKINIYPNPFEIAIIEFAIIATIIGLLGLDLSTFIFVYLVYLFFLFKVFFSLSISGSCFVFRSIFLRSFSKLCNIMNKH